MKKQFMGIIESIKTLDSKESKEIRCELSKKYKAYYKEVIKKELALDELALRRGDAF